MMFSLPAVCAGIFASVTSAFAAVRTLPTPGPSGYVDRESSVVVAFPTNLGRQVAMTLAAPFAPTNALALRHVFFVVREKTNLVMEVVETLQDPVEYNGESKSTQILKDEIVRPLRKGTAGKYTAGDGTLRRVTAMIEVRGQMRRMVFFTNNLEWSAKTVAELYRARWAVELFFKELKQTCQLHDFVGYNENAVKWQIWTGFLPFTMTPVG